jgi:hypothetical protein
VAARDVAFQLLEQRAHMRQLHVPLKNGIV